jgi:hypothetical protein
MVIIRYRLMAPLSSQPNLVLYGVENQPVGYQHSLLPTFPVPKGNLDDFVCHDCPGNPHFNSHTGLVRHKTYFWHNKYTNAKKEDLVYQRRCGNANRPSKHQIERHVKCCHAPVQQLCICRCGNEYWDSSEFLKHVASF